jgi:hypothetical protein
MKKLLNYVLNQCTDAQLVLLIRVIENKELHLQGNSERVSLDALYDRGLVDVSMEIVKLNKRGTRTRNEYWVTLTEECANLCAHAIRFLQRTRDDTKEFRTSDPNRVAERVGIWSQVLRERRESEYLTTGRKI